MDRRTAIKVILAGLFAPKIFVDAVKPVEAIAAPVVSPIIDGVKGATFFESGYVYSPYIPITIVRQLYPQSIVSDVVSVQPMQQPSGKIFYLNVEYRGRMWKVKDFVKRMLKKQNTIMKYANKKVDSNNFVSYGG